MPFGQIMSAHAVVQTNCEKGEKEIPGPQLLQKERIMHEKILHSTYQ